MLLPKLPYSKETIKKKIISFLGINLTENYKEGELSDSIGLSSENYPVLSQRKGREEITTYSDVADIFEWDGKKVVVAGGLLYFDGTFIANVTNDKKQFAVVNTHLIVMPDGIDIDMTSEYYDDEDVKHFTYEFLIDSTKSAAATNSSTFAANGKDITATLNPVLGQTNTSTMNFLGFGKVVSWGNGGYWYGPVLYTYGTDKTAVKACYQNGAWNMTSLAALEHLTSPFTITPNSINFTQGQIIIFKGSGSGLDVVIASNQGSITNYPDKTLYNTEGYYGVFNTCTRYEMDSSGAYIQGVVFDIYKADIDAKLFSLTFKVGDFVSCDTGDDDYTFSHAKVTALDDTTNKISLAFYDEDAQTWTKEVFATTAKSFSTALTFKKDYPDLDYICERGNRLWGVSNRTKTIYASQLGLPGKMYTDAGEAESTDVGAYSVAVGSEGEFTGICSYGGATLCWKENSVTKVLGDYPSNYYTNEYKVAGVQKGSERSLCIINETLLYKGVNGVFTYTGSTPSLISSALGRDVYHKAVAGTDTERYYISMTDDTHNPFLFTYDLVNGIWLKEDNIKADAFTKISGVQVQILGGYYYEDQFFMVTDGKIYKLGQDNDEKFNWYAELCPFKTYATSSSSYTRSFGKQSLSKITLQMEVSKGARVTVYVKEDDKPYKAVCTKSSPKKTTFICPIRIGRCDTVQVKLTGYGEVKVMGLERSYSIGSEA